MPKKDPRIDAYIAKSADFAKPILTHLRKLIHTACPEVVESIKWGMPAFDYKGPLCGLAAFKQHCSFGFWKGKLLFSSEQAEGVGMGHFGRLTKVSDLPADRVLLGIIKKAAKLNEDGVKVTTSRPKTKRELVVPDYFNAALAKNKKARSTFENFSYSHKKEYVEWITEAKREETRANRLATAMQWLAKGKPRHWKYMNC